MKQHLVCMILLCFTTIGFSAPSSAQIKVFACEPEWHALAEEIGGDHLSSFSATTAQQDPHHIEARPSLIAKARSADLIFCTGAELEVGWLPLLLRQSGNSRIQDKMLLHTFPLELFNMYEHHARLNSLGIEE
jgi:zinc/manganese transport system substrate-binding protein